MKTLLQLFAELGIRWRTDAFWRARLKLTLIYVGIVAVILAAFSTFLFIQIEQQLKNLSENQISATVSNEQAAEIAQATQAGTVTDVEEEVVRGKVVYVVEITTADEEIDVYIDRFTGAVVGVDGKDEQLENWNDLIINDFSENLWIANSVILALVALLSYFFAGWSLRPVQEQMRQQEQFSSDVAHELRTPLTAMLASVDSTLRKDESPETYQAALRDFRHETMRLIALTEDLLQSLRGNQANSFKTTEVSKIVYRVVERLAAVAAEKSVTFSLPENLSLEIPGNGPMLERMFENIFMNAIKFSHTGGVITISQSGKIICVKDGGEGMTEETKRQVFDRFYTIDQSRDGRENNGTGLGMAIVKQIADLHSIAIFVDSTPSKGTCIKLRFLQ